MFPFSGQELRLRGICDLETANAFLPEFTQAYNQRFAVSPQHPTNTHQALFHSPEELAHILCLHHTRIFSRNLTFQFKNREYQLLGQGKGYRLRGARLTRHKAFDGTTTVMHNGHVLEYRILTQGEPPVPFDDEKRVHHTVEQDKVHQTGQARVETTG